MDFIISFIADMAMTLPFLFIIAVACLIFEYKEHSFLSFITGAVSVYIAFQLFDVTPTYLLYGALAYIPVGLVWSVWRWRRHCTKTLEEFRETKKPSDRQLIKAMHKVTANEQTSLIVSWVIGWPWSFISNLLSDVLTFIEMIVKRFLKHVYIAVSSDAQSKLKATKIEK